MDVSVIIVNYNTKQLLSDCLTSIKNKTKDIEYEVIVVDNGSRDGSQEMLKRDYSWVRLIENKENLGFGKANNIGARYASGKYLFLLNSDTILLNNSLCYFFNYKENEDREDSRIGVIGCFLEDKNGMLNGIGGCLIKWYTPIKNICDVIAKRILKCGFIDRNKVKNIEYVIGANMFLSKKLFQIVGGFDEKFFMYSEEVDLQKRILEMDYKNIIIPGPRIIHLEGGSFSSPKRLTMAKYSVFQDSRHYYIHKHFNFIQIILWKILNIPYQLLIVFKQHWPLKDKIAALKLCIKG